MWQYRPDGKAEQVMCNPPKIDSQHSYQTDIRASVALILANKYKGGPSTSDPESQTMKKALQVWAEKLQTFATTDVDLKTFELLNTIAMHIFAGAAARQDKSVLGLVPVLTEAIASK